MVKKINLTTIILLFGYVFFAQAQLDSTGMEGNSKQSWSLLFDIQADRLTRSINADNSLKDYIELARQTGKEGDWQTAIELLGVVDDELADEQVGINAVRRSFFSQFDFVAISGTEFWFQKFGLSLTQDDSTITESENNPYFGVRILFEKSFTPMSVTRFDGEAKWGNQYISQNFFIKHYAPMGKSASWVLQNIFQYTDYKESSYSRLLDNTTKMDVLLSLSRIFDLKFMEELQTVRYGGNSEYLPSFLQNRATISTIYTLPFSTTEIRYYYKNRNYEDRQRNYHENVLVADLFPKSNRYFSLWVRGQFCRRFYHHEYVDSLYTNNFDELNFSCNLRYNLKPAILRFDGEYESKNYKHENSVIPNYTDVVLEPSVAFHAGSPLTIKIGYQYRTKMHGSASSDEQETDLEDFFSHGPVFTIDMLVGGGLMASVSNNYYLKRYKDVFEDEYGLTLYTDKNINSLYFFLTWNPFKHWEFDVLLNYDVEKQEYNNSLDMMSNFINFELSYKF
ncbi:hypothetical protein JW935_25200 [candidate division KSB1 bacterium]|nr:hypothetical protein [candidate division KSB1 bacterium]